MPPKPNKGGGKKPAAQQQQQQQPPQPQPQPPQPKEEPKVVEEPEMVEQFVVAQKKKGGKKQNQPQQQQAKKPAAQQQQQQQPQPQPQQQQQPQPQPQQQAKKPAATSPTPVQTPTPAATTGAPVSAWGAVSLSSQLAGLSVNTQPQQPPQAQPKVQAQAQAQPVRTTTTTTTTTPSQPSAGPSKALARIRDDEVADLAQRVTGNTNFPPVVLYVNQFLTKFNSKPIYQYQVEFAPHQETKKARYVLVDKSGAHFRGIYKYDGTSILFSTVDAENTTFQIDGVVVSFTKVASVSHTDAKAAQFFNVIFKQFLKEMKLTLIGRQYFNSLQKREFKEYGLEVWSGFHTSINHISAGTSLLCDVAHKVVRTTTVLDKIHKLLGRHNGQEDVAASISGHIIITKYNNRTYRVSSIKWNMTPNSKLNQSTTFLEYYKSHYPKSKITDMNQPLLEARVKRAGQFESIYLIPELSYLTGMDDEMLSDRHLMMDLAKIKFVAPKERKQILENFVGSLRTHPKISEDLKKWEFSFGNCMEVSGGQLPEPTVTQAKNLLSGYKWAVVCSSKDQSEVMRFVETLRRESGLGEPQYLTPGAFNGKAFCDQIAQNKGYSFYFLVIGNQTIFYEVVKQTTLINLKVITQCAHLKTLTKGRPVAVKIYHQVAAKLGLAPWTVRSPIFNTIPSKKIMLVGIDVTHNTAQRGSSVVGVVSSLNESFSLFHTEAILQNKPGKEIVETLQPAISKSLKVYSQKNGYLPELVIVFRDGVGDGMIDLVRHHEVNAVKEAINAAPSVYGTKPKLIYTVVKKNTNTRFFRKDNGENPSPGTVVDNGCVHKGWYDFFLVSQKALQGSVNPTHYHIVYDEAKIPAQDFQVFTYANCFLYYNFDKAVSVPAVVQYAHKLAFLIGKHVHSSISNDLSNNLYFL